MQDTWTIEQVAAVAPSPRSVAAAEPLAVPTRWTAVGADDRALWGRCQGSGAEPYETAVDHAEVAWRCTCPSRKLPCKHALALLLLWVRGVGAGTRPESVQSWLDARDRRSAHERERGAGDPSEPAPGVEPDADPGGSEPTDRAELDRARDERVARMLEGLTQLDRWLEDRMRTGLADPALARYATWDELAARLVDARAGALANRVRRLAGLVGAGPDWHSEVLAELGFLHLIAQAGRRLPTLPGPLADAVATASGWQVRQADVLAGVPETDDWFVAGRSDVREDRIEVRRIWLRGERSGAWAMLLSFAAYQQRLDDSFSVGTVVHADLHRYPGGSLRALAGHRYADPLPFHTPAAVGVAAACDAIGTAIALEPWLERYPATIRGTPSVLDGRWVITDQHGSLPLLGDDRALATLLAASAGSPVDVTVEWTPRGVQPLTLHLADRTLDVGPRADPTFVSAA
ncbi:MAG: SWIM zinc finger family protein [Ilumatobacteraceae bacterium]|nr:SWIM zinc finger family protein [Ilumatobacteraceae bacterium]